MKKLIIASLIAISVAYYGYYNHWYGHYVAAPQTLTTTGSTSSMSYKNGTYVGTNADAYYGNVQVQVTISGGKISSVTFLDYPHDRSTSQQINSQAMPYLKQEAIMAQSAQVNIVSGATDTSQAFQESLASALNKAQS